MKSTSFWWPWATGLVALSLVAGACTPAAPTAPTATPIPATKPTTAPTEAAAKPTTAAAAPTAPAAKPAAQPGLANVPRTPSAANIKGEPPTQPMEFVISTSPGGGSDIYARFMIGILQKYNLSPQPVLPINKEGGAGAVAMQYLAGKKGQPGEFMITLNSYLTTPMLQNLPFKSDSFTAIALMGLDSFFLWVPSDSPWQTFNDFLTAARTDSLTVGGTGSKQEDEILFKLIELRGQTQPFKYVPFRGGGDVATALAGQQVQATVNNPSEALPFYPDKVRPLVAFLEERSTSPQFKDLPTAKELGLDIAYSNMRGIVAAPEIPAGHREWLTGLMQEVYVSPDWQDFLQKNALDPQFKSGAEFEKFLDEFDKLHRDAMTQAGWIQ
jgi:putative tricarboxylic transport membrane protein